MDVKNQKNLAARLFGVGKKRIYFNPLRLDEIKKAITREDIRKLVDKKAIKIKQKKGVSRARVRHRDIQRAKGRQRGHGRRKGTAKARTNPKRAWITKIRALRRVLAEMRNKKEIDTSEYRMLYLRAKGNFFRNKRHLLEYISEMKKTK